MITIINYGIGNLASIANMIKKVGGKATITSDHKEIEQAEKLLLPGVGHFGKGMQNLKDGNFIELIKKKALQDKVPVLGICLGMQLLTSHSEEGDADGLNLIEAQTKKFDLKNFPNLRVPHMGWSDVAINKNSKLFDGINEIPRYYFVHSYFVTCKDPANSIGRCTYGIDFDCAIQKDNVMGVQFHPEKSHRFGMKIFENFIKNF
jgi:imidazole glycerol-phosphate synthase subunit HisH